MTVTLKLELETLKVITTRIEHLRETENYFSEIMEELDKFICVAENLIANADDAICNHE